MRVSLNTNVQPITAGDDITIAVHFDTWEAASTVGYGVWIAAPVQRTIAAFVPFWKGPEYDWTVDTFGQQVVFQVIAYPVVHSAFSDPVLIEPAVPELVAPTDGELLHAGSPYTFRWNQTPPAPPSYRLRFSTDGAQTFPELGPDIPGTADSVTRTIPATPTDQGRVRLEATFLGFDPLFNPPISVKTTDKTLLHVVTPPTWHIDHDGMVSWTAAGDVDHFKVELSRNGGQSWTTLAASVGGTDRHLTVGVDPPASTSCHVKVTAVGPSGTVSATSGAFHIAAAPPHHGHGPRD